MGTRPKRQSRAEFGSTCLLQGDLVEARALLERTLADYTASLDAEARIHFGHDVRPIAAANSGVSDLAVRRGGKRPTVRRISGP